MASLAVTVKKRDENVTVSLVLISKLDLILVSYGIVSIVEENPSTQQRETRVVKGKVRDDF